MEILFGKHLIKVVFGKVFWKYKIFGCVGEAKFLTFDPQPSDTNMTSWIWTITKTLDTMTMECNGELLLNLKFAESDTVWCVKNWAGDVVDSLKFSPNDTASQQYQVTDKDVGKCFLSGPKLKSYHLFIPLPIECKKRRYHSTGRYHMTPTA